MKAFWKQIVINNILRDKNLENNGKALNDFQVAKSYRELKITISHFFKDFIFYFVCKSLLTNKFHLKWD